MRVIPQTPPRDLQVPRELRIARCSSRVFVGSAECSRRGTGGRGSPERCRTGLTAFRFLPRKWAPQICSDRTRLDPTCRSIPWDTMIRAVGRGGRSVTGFEKHCRAHLSLPPPPPPPLLSLSLAPGKGVFDVVLVLTCELLPGGGRGGFKGRSDGGGGRGRGRGSGGEGRGDERGYGDDDGRGGRGGRSRGDGQGGGIKGGSKAIVQPHKHVIPGRVKMQNGFRKKTYGTIF
ncbi:hypothetical protein C4D60_Mb04t15990 [Musa balbisiana]|uniref:Uncharacterized protein n=1 Tax=Musa balbisiana TaxID=52838 RepID=A0A4S8KCD9_MUSBA|nr:hypothetical protein C4D60_Mb04t15990 [Musa balbisiana]